MRKRPDIPEDVFFDTSRRRQETETVEAPPEEPAIEALTETREPARRGRAPAPRATRGQTAARRPEPESQDAPARIGRPPAQEGEKVAVTLYLTVPVAQLLEEVRFRLMTEYGVKTSKSAIADFAMRAGLADLEAAADDLRRE